MINSRVFLIGNVGKLEGQYTPKEAKYLCKGSLAVDIGFGNDKETNWYNFVVWEGFGETFFKLVDVGTRLLIEGDQLIRKWEDKDGKEHTVIDVTVRDFTVIARGKKKEGAGGLEAPF